LVDFWFQSRRSPAQAVLVTRAGRASRADDRRCFLRAISDPADIENLGYALQLPLRLEGDQPRAAAGVTALFDGIYRLGRVNILRAQCRRKVDARAQYVWIAGRIPAANRLATVQAFVVCRWGRVFPVSLGSRTRDYEPNGLYAFTQLQ
jgi:hypothetical protein